MKPDELTKANAMRRIREAMGRGEDWADPANTNRIAKASGAAATDIRIWWRDIEALQQRELQAWGKLQKILDDDGGAK